MSHLLLFGGTFDPIHHGHLITARAARELLKADQVLFIPAHISPHKQEGPAPASAAHRLAMLQLAIASQSDLAIDDRELARAGPSYTADTLAELKSSRPHDHFTLLLGLDQLPKFHLWHKVDQILAGAEIAVLSRPFHGGEPLTVIERTLGPAIVDRFRKALLPTPLIEISATMIRQRVSRNLPITYLVPESVAAYIASHHLYRQVPE